MPNCPKCGALVTVDQVKCIECGTKLIEKPKREGFFGYFFSGIFALLIPLLGFIIFLSQRVRKPKTSRFTLIMTILGFIVWVLLILLAGYIFMGILEGIFGGSGALLFF